MALAQSYGRVTVARAYAEWNLLSERLTVYKAGIEPAFAPVLRPEGGNREGKSLADTVMVSDGVDILWTHQPDVLVLVTSDKDLVPLARLARQRGALVVVLGSDLTAVQLLEMANDFVTYRHLIKELGRPEDKIAPSRVRAEPHARPSRDGAVASESAAREPRATQRRARPSSRAAAAAAPRETEIAPSTPSAAEGAETATPPSDEGAQSVVVRRRRRRGGRGRRVGSTADAAAQPAGDEPTEVQPVDLGAASLELPATVAADGDGAAGHELPLPSGDVGLEKTHGGEGEGNVVAPAAEGTELRPWERWPEPAPAQPVGAAVTRAETPDQVPTAASDDAQAAPAKATRTRRRRAKPPTPES
jgi:hypothetical protein